MVAEIYSDDDDDKAAVDIVAQLTDVHNESQRAESQEVLLPLSDFNQFLAEEHLTLEEKQKALSVQCIHF